MRKKTELLIAVLLAALTIVVVNCGKNTDKTYSLSGTVTSSGTGLQGVTMTLSGAGSATVTTDFGGNFSFANLSNGSYTVTPAKAGYAFNPTSSAQTVNSSNVTGVSFTAAAATGANLFDGTYTGSWNKACPNCGVPASAGTFAATLANGVFTDTQFTLTSGDSGIRFDTGAVSSSGAITGTGATPSQCSSSVSTFTGQITSTSSGGAVMTMTYSRTASPEGCQAESGTITATRTTAGATPIYSISGTVTSSGTGTQGVTMTLTSAGTATMTATTDAGGNYTFAGLVNGNYTVTPGKTGYTFSPSSSVQTINNANNTGVNFSATATTGAGQFDGTYTGSWTNLDSGNTATGTFTTTLTNGAFTNTIITITSGNFGILFTSGTVSSSGAITGTGIAPGPSCSNSVGTFTGQITLPLSGSAVMNMSYSRTADGGCGAETGSITATRTP